MTGMTGALRRIVLLSGVLLTLLIALVAFSGVWAVTVLPAPPY